MHARFAVLSFPIECAFDRPVVVGQNRRRSFIQLLNIDFQPNFEVISLVCGKRKIMVETYNNGGRG